MTHLTGEERAKYVRSMFGRLAPRYDLMNRLMTAGQDVRWRRLVIERAHLSNEATLLDIATGTGEIAQEGLRQQPGIMAIGGDFSLEMMLWGRTNPDRQLIHWIAADALNLPFPDESFNAVTSGFLMRNVIDVPGALQEQQRVVKRGGRVVILESSPPKENLLRPLIRFHLNHVIPTIGKIVTGQEDAYHYLPDSTQQFQDPDSLADLMAGAGLVDISYKLYMFGTIAIHDGRKPL